MKDNSDKESTCSHTDFASCNCGCLVCSICDEPVDSRECEIGHKDGVILN